MPLPHYDYVIKQIDVVESYISTLTINCEKWRSYINAKKTLFKEEKELRTLKARQEFVEFGASEEANRKYAEAEREYEKVMSRVEKDEVTLNSIETRIENCFIVLEQFRHQIDQDHQDLILHIPNIESTIQRYETLLNTITGYVIEAHSTWCGPAVTNEFGIGPYFALLDFRTALQWEAAPPERMPPAAAAPEAAHEAGQAPAENVGEGNAVEPGINNTIVGECVMPQHLGGPSH